MSARSEEVQAATARRTEITDALLDLLTSDAFTTKELQRYRFVGEIFAIGPVVRELCSQASTLESRTELALSIALSALAIAIDDTPPPTPQRILDRREARRESREAEKQLGASVSGKVAVEPGESQNGQAPAKSVANVGPA